MKSKKFIAHVDVIGMRSMASMNPGAYGECLNEFVSYVELQSYKLDKDDSVYLYSDCAYIETTEFGKIAEFVQSVRCLMMSRGYFLKGAIGRGNLEPKTTTNTDYKARVQAVYFGPDINPIYSELETMKGIGVSVLNSSLLSKSQNRKYLVHSCYLQHTNKRGLVPFIDLKYSRDEMSSGILQQLLTRWFDARAQSRRFARYYVSIIISWIQSTDFRDRVGASKHNADVERPIYRFIISGQLDAHFSDITGYEYIYYALLNKLRNDNTNSKQLIDRLLDRMFRKKRVMVALERNIPTTILSLENKQYFLDELGRHRIKL